MKFELPPNWKSPYRLTDVGLKRDGLSYAVERLGLDPKGNLTLYHQTHRGNWPGSHDALHISAKRGQLGTLGAGFYTSTIPVTGAYGNDRLTLELPVAALKGVPVLELPPGTVDKLWDVMKLPVDTTDVHIVAAQGPTFQGQDRATWMTFKPQSEDWLNASLTRAEF